MTSRQTVQIEPIRIPRDRLLTWCEDRVSLYMLSAHIEHKGVKNAYSDWAWDDIICAFVDGAYPFEEDTELPLYGDWKRPAEECDGTDFPCTYTLVKEDEKLFAYAEYDLSFWHNAQRLIPAWERDYVFKKVVEFV